MTRNTVVWDKEVEDSFMNAWLAADSPKRAILSGIANWMDRILAEDPELKGQALSHPLHREIKTSFPNLTTDVSVTYEVFPDDRQVRVTLLVIRNR